MTILERLQPAHTPMADDLLARTGQLADDFARDAADKDAAECFVADHYPRLKEAGLVSAGVPAELGGGGLEIRDVCAMLQRLAHGCSSTALALSMHSHQVVFPAWRWRHQPEAKPKVEPLLRRVAEEKIVLLSSGGGDWIGGSGRAEPVEGGYRITARKPFVSGAPAGDILMTSAVTTGESPEVLHFALPMAAPEVQILDTWHVLGMRSTGSQDVTIEGFFLPEDKVAARRPAGKWHPLFMMLGTVAFPLIYAVYLGVAERARDLAIGIAGGKAASHYQLARAGEMETALTAARLAHAHMVATAELNAPSMETIKEVMTGRRLVEENAIRTVEMALELAGGPGFYRKAELERLFRDIQAARYHPLQKPAQAEFAGAMALGADASEIY